MNRCKTCKHWDAFPEYGRPGWGSCRIMDTASQDMSPLVTLTVYGWETEGADVDTHETFGCVEHKESET